MTYVTKLLSQAVRGSSRSQGSLSYILEQVELLTEKALVQPVKLTGLFLQTLLALQQSRNRIWMSLSPMPSSPEAIPQENSDDSFASTLWEVFLL